MMQCVMQTVMYITWIHSMISYCQSSTESIDGIYYNSVEHTKKKKKTIVKLII